MISCEELRLATGIGFQAETPRPELVEKLGDESPGQQDRHYAPNTPLVLLEPGANIPEGRGRKLDLPGNPRDFAAQLYATLHGADSEGWDWIAIDAPPETSEWEGVRDRLKRASHRKLLLP